MLADIRTQFHYKAFVNTVYKQLTHYYYYFFVSLIYLLVRNFINSLINILSRKVHICFIATNIDREWTEFYFFCTIK